MIPKGKKKKMLRLLLRQPFYGAEMHHVSNFCFPLKKGKVPRALGPLYPDLSKGKDCRKNLCPGSDPAKDEQEEQVIPFFSFSLLVSK